MTDIDIMLQNMLPVGSVTGVDVPPPASHPEGKLGPLSTVSLGPDTGVDPPVLFCRGSPCHLNGLHPLFCILLFWCYTKVNQYWQKFQFEIQF